MAAVLLFEAIDTASAILNAVLVWIVVAAFVVTFVVLSVLAAVSWAVEWAWCAVRRRHTPASRPQSPSQDSRVLTQAPSAPQGRTAPSWAHTEHDHHETKEAA